MDFSRRKSATASAIITIVFSGIMFFSAHAPASTRADEPIKPLPAPPKFDEAKVRLGERLFADKRFSADGTVSCQSCHLPDAGGADPRRHSVSAFGKVRELNSPSIFNLGVLTAGLNWTGRTPSLEHQISGSISNKDTMAHDWKRVLETLSSDASMVSQFASVYGGESAINQKNVMDAIVTFERSLITPSRFDDYLNGNDTAISMQERMGYEKFKSVGCTACHNGVAVGGNTFFKMGLTGDYFADRVKRGKGAMVEVDKGRILHTKNEADLHVFRVAPLRNVALTAPYFHDGSVDTLDEAILLMGKFQLGQEIPPQDRKLIESFLKSLTGKALEK